MQETWVQSLGREGPLEKGITPTMWVLVMLPPPIFLPGEFCGQKSLVGCSSWGCKESDMIEVTQDTHTHTHTHTHTSYQAAPAPGIIFYSLCLFNFSFPQLLITPALKSSLRVKAKAVVKSHKNLHSTSVLQVFPVVSQISSPHPTSPSLPPFHLHRPLCLTPSVLGCVCLLCSPYEMLFP